MRSYLRKKICDIQDNHTAIIMLARNTIFFSKGEPWFKKVGSKNYGVSVGCYDGAEKCESIGIYLLYQIYNVISKENIGLYIDNGLGIFRNMSGPKVERKKKDPIKIFKSNGLSITVKTNLNVADFLDIHFEIVQHSYQPYKN